MLAPKSSLSLLVAYLPSEVCTAGIEKITLSSMKKSTINPKNLNIFLPFCLMILILNSQKL